MSLLSPDWYSNSFLSKLLGKMKEAMLLNDKLSFDACVKLLNDAGMTAVPAGPVLYLDPGDAVWIEGTVTFTALPEQEHAAGSDFFHGPCQETLSLN